MRTPIVERTKRRRPKRGAAMVEGIIVISTFLVVLGLIVYVRKCYGAKLDMQQNTRSTVLYYASHACEGDPGAATNLGTGGVVPVPGQAADNASNRSNIPSRAAADRSWNSAESKLSGTVSWQAVWDQNANGQNASIDLRKHTLSRTINAESHVTCNEKKYDSQWSAWLEFGVDFFKTGGGAGDLFR